MSQALSRPLLTVDEFHDWEPPPGLEDRRWELVDGEPVCMAPPGVNHGAIQSQVGMLLGLHLRTHRPSCRIIVTPGVIPGLRSRVNQRVPDLGVSCGPFVDSRSLPDPVLLVEILSPSNEAKTRANAWAYATIPSVQEVLILSSTAVRAEILRQGDETPAIARGKETLRLESIGYEGCLDEFYATTDLT
nr:Uma2 family endonuclease [uncultured Rhodopila sp.]